MAEYRPNKQQVTQSFAAAAASYDKVAVLQRQTADELLDRLSFVKLQPSLILDLGTGTGRNLALLHQRYPNARLLAMDIAMGMLQQAKKRFRHDLGLRRWLPGATALGLFTGDAEQIPLADNSVDLVFANLSLQWCEPRQVFKEIQRVLAPGGLLVYTSLGPETLTELRQAWATVDDYPHVNVFYDVLDIGNAMTAAGLQDCVLDVEPYTLQYPDAMMIMRDLKTLGAHNVNDGRRRGLTGKRALKQVIAAYEGFRQHKQLPVSYEVIFGHAWKLPSAMSVADDGSVRIPLGEIKRR